MKKSLKEITEEECKIICEMYGEPYIKFYINDSDYFGLYVVISTTTTLNHKSRYDSSINIFINGNVTLYRNDGGWNGSRNEDICAIMATDFLRNRGYEFKYELPKKVERKIKLLNLKNL